MFKITKTSILDWLARRQMNQCAEELDKKLSDPLTTNVCHLRLVDPATVKREDFGDKFDRVIETTEGKDESNNS